MNGLKDGGNTPFFFFSDAVPSVLVNMYTEWFAPSVITLDII